MSLRLSRKKRMLELVDGALTSLEAIEKAMPNPPEILIHTLDQIYRLKVLIDDEIPEGGCE